MAAVFDSLTATHHQVFTLGHPFKSLYALHVLDDYLTNKRRLALREQQSTSPDPQVLKTYADSAVRCLSHVVAGLSDPAVVDTCSSAGQKKRLCDALVNCYFRLLKDG